MIGAWGAGELMDNAKLTKYFSADSVVDAGSSTAPGFQKYDFDGFQRHLTEMALYVKTVFFHIYFYLYLSQNSFTVLLTFPEFARRHFIYSSTRTLSRCPCSYFGGMRKLNALCI